MKKRILIVDDEESIRKSLVGALTDEGYEVFDAEDGKKALELTETTRPHLILLDIWMPQMDGMEVLRILKRDFPEVPVIMISGHGTIETAVKAAKLGAYDFVEKPLSLEKIIISLDHALREKSLESEISLYRARFDVSTTIVGESPPIKKLKEEIHMAAPSGSYVLISGKTARARSWWPGRSLP